MKTFYDGERIDLGIRPLTPGGMNRLVVIISANIVEDASADGVDRALIQLTQLHTEIYGAIDALVGKRAEIEEFRRNGG